MEELVHLRIPHHSTLFKPMQLLESRRLNTEAALLRKEHEG